MKNRSFLFVVLALLLGVMLGYFMFRSGPVENGNSTEKQVEASQWICSMHLQVVRSAPGSCPLCGMDLIKSGDVTLSSAPYQFRMTENAIALANIETTKIGKNGDAEDGTIQMSGKIKENEENNAVQSSYFDGRIEKLYITHIGQEVRSGQKLATLYAPNLIGAQQEFLTATSIKESQPQLYKAVRNKLKLLKLSDQQIDTIEASGTVIKYFPIYATVTGVVTELNLTEGNYVREGQLLVKVNNLYSVWAEFDSYENQSSTFKKGQDIQVKVPSHPEKRFEGTISFVDPILDEEKRTFVVRAILENANRIFKPGMFVTGHILNPSNDDEDHIIVPASAVLWTGDRSVVYISAGASVFEMREVVLGPKLGENYVILNGLKIGEEIVTHGTFTVDAAAQLQGKKSMMNR